MKMENTKSMERNLNRYSNNGNMYNDNIDESFYSIKILDDRYNKVNMSFEFLFLY